jgi:hypothetical protein
MGTFTCTLPDNLLKMLSENAVSLSVPERKLIENALRLYLGQLEKEEYIMSFKRASQDNDVMSIAEEGMPEFLNQLKE